MENPFKAILSNEKLPVFLKDKVMEDVELLKLSFELAELFAVKYPESVNDILKTTRNNRKK